MRRFSFLRALAVLAALTLVPLPALGDEIAESTERLYLHNAAEGCADTSQQFLVDEKPTAGSNCGFIYGLPLNEVEHHTNQGLFLPREYATHEGFQVVLDATRNLSGKVVVSSRTSVCVAPATPSPAPPLDCAETGQGTGAGEVVVDLVATADLADSSSVSLGSTQVKQTVTPGTVSYEIPFLINLPDTVDRATLSAVRLSVHPRGTHVHSGYVNASGLSLLDLPSLIPVDATD
jgi:hypothetical protein